jgi:hypothetical protein
MITSNGFVTVAVGLTDIVKFIGVPKHPLTIGVTTILPVMIELVVLVVVKLPMLPVPLAAKPMDGLLFVHV